MLQPVYVYNVERILSSDLRRLRVLISVLFLYTCSIYTHVKCEIIPDINLGFLAWKYVFQRKLFQLLSKENTEKGQFCSSFLLYYYIKPYSKS